MKHGTNGRARRYTRLFRTPVRSAVQMVGNIARHAVAVAHRMRKVKENAVKSQRHHQRTLDAIIGKVAVCQEPGSTVDYKRDRSTILGKNAEGVVDRVLLTTNKDGKRSVTVRVAQTRWPELGDKVRCRGGGARRRATRSPYQPARLPHKPQL